MKTYQLYFTVDKQTTVNNFVFRTTIASPATGAYVLEKFETVSGDYTYSFTPTVSGLHSLQFGGDSDSSPYVQDNIFYIDNILVKDTTIEVPSYTDYYPFGMPMPHRIDGVDSYRYTYQGQEKDPETGKEAFQLRLWDGRIGRWLTTDPKGQYASPYLGMGNNPISSVDPDGGSTNPVVGLDGQTLGATESGMVGDIIVMDELFFSEGMSDEVANFVGKKLQLSNFSEIQKSIISKRIDNRPDRDGFVTFSEARSWSQDHSSPLYVDTGKINFKSTALNVNDFGESQFLQVNFFNLYNNKYGNKNYLYRPAIRDRTLSFVYGTLRIELINKHTGEISLRTGDVGNSSKAFDRFDFQNPFFHWIAGNGNGFDIIGYGRAYINLTKPAPRPIYNIKL